MHFLRARLSLVYHSSVRECFVRVTVTWTLWWLNGNCLAVWRTCQHLAYRAVCRFRCIQGATKETVKFLSYLHRVWLIFKILSQTLNSRIEMNSSLKMPPHFKHYICYMTLWLTWWHTFLVHPVERLMTYWRLQQRAERLIGDLVLALTSHYRYLVFDAFANSRKVWNVNVLCISEEHSHERWTGIN